jgi:hypothetical protein
VNSIELEALQPAADDRGDLESDLERRIGGMRLEPGGRCSPDAPSLLAVDRADGATVTVPRAFLDLDEDEPGASSNDQVELVPTCADVRADYAVAAEAIVPRGDPLSAIHRER